MRVFGPRPMGQCLEDHPRHPLRVVTPTARACRDRHVPASSALPLASLGFHRSLQGTGPLTARGRARPEVCRLSGDVSVKTLINSSILNRHFLMDYCPNTRVNSTLKRWSFPDRPPVEPRSFTRAKSKPRKIDERSEMR